MPSIARSRFFSLINLLRLFALLGSLAALSAQAQAQAQAQTPPTGYPAREVRVVVPAEPGGGIDAVARLLAQQLAQRFNQTFLVLNRSGADGNIGTASVAHANPDGLTLLVTGMSHLSGPLLHAEAGYDALRDFEPVARMAAAPSVLLVHTSLKDLSLAQLQREPGKDGRGLAFGSAGIGHTSHLAAEVFMSRTGARWLQVPYRGTAPALRALMSGEVQVMFVPAGSVAAAVATGRVQALAVAHPTRLPQSPDLPTLTELGVKGAEFAQWYGLFAPAGTPPAVLDALSAGTVAAVQTGPLARYMTEQGLQNATLGRQEFSRNLQTERNRLASLLVRERIQGAVQ